MPSGLYSYLLPESACAGLFNPHAFWPTIEELGTLVDESPGYTPEMFHILLDYLSTECRIILPIGLMSQYSVAQPEDAFIVGVFARHDLAVIRRKIDKLFRGKICPAKSVFEIYAREFSELPTDQDWLGYLSRQQRHLTTFDSVLVVLCRD